ncbi:MAG TPA: DUF3089 domain-containing protein [Acidimicrobiales bacterium]|nr:DUF3089 domain-containing protein [Acidimicrobiales bacterium]
MAQRRAFWARVAVVGSVLAGAALIGPVTSGAASSSSGAAKAPSNTVWLCKPGLASDPCESGLTATVVRANGATSVMSVKDAKNAPIDCFYVYPTVSGEPTANSDLSIQPIEKAVAVAQASRFSEVCKVYAPMYHQLTLASIGGKVHLTAANLAEAYDSARSAFRDYIAHYNHGRGIVFIGHSQGAAVLIQLLKQEVDNDPAIRHRLVSAILLGGNVTVPIGKSVGGDFAHIPACRSITETGCVVAYSSFLDPPPANSLFGRVGQGVSALSGQGANRKFQVLCTNPAALGGGSAMLVPYFPNASTTAALGAEASGAPNSVTPWVTYPDLYSAQCMSGGGATWLQVTPITTPGDTRPVVTQQLGPTWGLHLVDVNLALGNFVALVSSQEKAYAAHH